jgi:endonuclease/exonuclease/phosphatase family metal-dependent hydrolase
MENFINKDYINNKYNINKPQNYKLLFWNLLCDEYSYDWKTAPKIELKYKVWEYRIKLFNNIFSKKENNSDIYCFVEVDKQDDIYMMLNSIAGHKLFEPIYFPRPNTPLGIMIVYNRYKFKLINSYRYLLGKCIKQHFALVCILQEISFPYNIFAVMVTHLKAWEKNEKIRIKQINKLFNNMENDKNFKNLKINKIILCGDLNTNPDSDCIKLILNNNLQSVFDISEERKDDGNYTLVIDTVDEGIKKLKFDYIFYSNNIEIINRILPINFLDFERGLPNENFPSDHLYLFTEFKFSETMKFPLILMK